MSALVQQARSYLGVKYRHRGRDPKTGLDCAGLPWRCYADLGVKLPDLRLYGREPHQDGMMNAVRAALGDPIWQGAKGSCSRAVLQPGDVAVLVFVKEPHHMAIVGDDKLYGLSLIHADGTLGTSRVVEHGMESQHLAMICAIFRRPV